MPHAGRLAIWGSAILLAAGGVAVAQTPQRPAARARQPAPHAQAQPPAAAPTPAPAAAQPQPKLLRTESWNFDSWTTTCREFEGKKKVCAAQLQVTQANSQHVLLAWTITLDGEGHAVTVLQTPTGVSITPGVEVRLGKATPRKVPFTTCDTGNCTATLPMDRNLVRDMTMTPEAEVVLYAPNGTGVQFKFPLKGFEKAYAQLSH